MSKLNIDTFNQILVKYSREKDAELKLLTAEMGIISELFMNKVGLLLDELVNYGYTSDLFTEIINIKDNSEHIIKRIEELKGDENNG